MDDSECTSLLAREPIFHREPAGLGRAGFADLLAPDFWEIGASGRVYELQEALDVLVERHADGHVDDEDAWAVTEPRCRRLGPDSWLLTYRLEGGGRSTRRATVWERSDGGAWRVAYHQGTPIS